MSAPMGGAWSGGSAPGGGLLQEGACSRRGSAPGGSVSQHALRLRQTPSPLDRMTDTCKNITFANFVCGR